MSPVSTLLLYTMIMGLGNDFLSLPFTSLNKPSIEHGFKLTSVYSHYLKESGHREITTYHSRTAITVDYIFYSPAQREESGWAGEICVCVFNRFIFAQATYTCSLLLKAFSCFFVKCMVFFFLKVLQNDIS